MSLEYIDWDIGDVTVINLSGRITLGEGTSRVRAAVREALARGRKNLLLNMNDVFYVDSSGLGELVTLHTTVRKAGGHMKLMKLNELTRNLLTVTRLYTVFVRQLLAEDPSRANELIEWGSKNKCFTHPLHYISDMLFNGTLQRGKELPLANSLIEAGADLNFQKDGKGDTPLIGVASLGAEDVGLRLLEAGAKPEICGLFGETALHWAALLGEDRLAAKLIAGSDVNLKDERYNSPPLGWAVYGWSDPPAGNHGRQREVVALLIAAGARIESDWMENEKVRGDPAMLAAFRSTPQ